MLLDPTPRSAAALALCTALVSLGHAALADDAKAQKDPASQSQPDGTGRQCIVHGKAHMPKNLKIYDSHAGGKVIGHFTGTESPVVATDFPKAAGGRVFVQVSDGTGKGNFRLEGWIEADDLPMYTTTTIPVVQGHVWMGKAREVHFAGGKSSRLKVKQQLKYPLSQTFATWTDCSNLSISPGTPPGFTVPGKARGYLIKKDSLELYDGYSRDNSQVTTLFNASEEGVLLWSEDPIKRGYVHVIYNGEIVVDAWAKFGDLKRLPWGERADQYDPVPRRTRSSPKLAVQGETKKVVAPKEVAIRLEPKDSARPVGVIEPGAEILVTDIVVGHASVLPTGLEVAPEGGHFWADAKALGLIN